MFHATSATVAFISFSGFNLCLIFWLQHPSGWLNGEVVVSIVCKIVNDNHHSGIKVHMKHGTWHMKHIVRLLFEWAERSEKIGPKFPISAFQMARSHHAILSMDKKKTDNFTQRTIIINGLFHLFFFHFPILYQMYKICHMFMSRLFRENGSVSSFCWSFYCCKDVAHSWWYDMNAVHFTNFFPHSTTATTTPTVPVHCSCH